MLEIVGPIVPENPFVQIDPIGDGYRVRQLWPVSDLSPPFARLVSDPRVTGPLGQLFGGDTPILSQ